MQISVTDSWRSSSLHGVDRQRAVLALASRHADQRRATWAAALFVMPVPALIVMGVVRPGWPSLIAGRR